MLKQDIKTSSIFNFVHILSKGHDLWNNDEIGIKTSYVLVLGKILQQNEICRMAFCS